MTWSHEAIPQDVWHHYVHGHIIWMTVHLHELEQSRMNNINNIIMVVIFVAFFVLSSLNTQLKSLTLDQFPLHSLVEQ